MGSPLWASVSLTEGVRAVEFPFGLDPCRPVPGTGAVHLTVEGVGENTISDPDESIVGLASMVVVINTGEASIIGDATNYLTVTSWEPTTRKLRVKLNNTP